MIRLLTENEQEKEEITAATYELVRECIAQTLAEEGRGFDCEVSLTITDDEGIRAINAETRGIDRPTDVLSFPMLEFDADGDVIDAELDTDDGFLLLGDIVIDAERARAQAEEYGHSMRRELAFLTVHSTLHLLGYDHVDDPEGEWIMFAKQDKILDKMGITR